MSLVLNVEILGEFKNLTAATKGAQTQLQQMNARASKVSASIGKAFAAIGVGLSFRFIANELEEASKAAIEDVKSQELLANQMRNTTDATDDQIKSVEKQINKLQLTASVADDKLRPAFSTLLRVTKDSGEAMKLLNLATDISAGSGKELSTVTIALTKAFQGKMGALQKLGIPMSDSIQNAQDYAKATATLNKLTDLAATQSGPALVKTQEKIAIQQQILNELTQDGIDWQGDLAKAFQGSADAAANTDPYQRMQIIFGEMQEQIGMALLPLLEEFSTWLATPEGQEKLGQIVDLIKEIIGNFTDMAKWVLDNKDWLLPMVAAIGTVTAAWKVAMGAVEAYRAAVVIAQALAGPAGWVSLAGGALALGAVATASGQGKTTSGQDFSTSFGNVKTDGGKTTVVQNISIKGQQSAKQIADAISKAQKVTGTKLNKGLF